MGLGGSRLRKTCIYMRKNADFLSAWEKACRERPEMRRKRRRWIKSADVHFLYASVKNKSGYFIVFHITSVE